VIVTGATDDARFITSLRARLLELGDNQERRRQPKNASAHRDRPAASRLRLKLMARASKRGRTRTVGQASTSLPGLHAVS